jgi:hypothetical protein
MTARAQRRMLNEVKKNSRVSAKNVQKCLEHANIFVGEPMISKTLNKNGVHGRTPTKKPLLSEKKHSCPSEVCKKHLDVPVVQIFWEQMKLQLSCLEVTHNILCGEKKAHHTTINIKTSFQL